MNARQDCMLAHAEPGDCSPTGAIELQMRAHESSAGGPEHLLRSARKLFAGLAGAVLMLTGSQAMADNCASYVANLYGWIADGSATHYSVRAVRVTARGGDGFSSFSMAEPYTPSWGIANSGAAARHVFYLVPDRTSGVLSGRFQDVFPGRINGETDLTTLSILRSGAVRFRLNDWGGAIGTLSNLECFPGHTGRAFVMTGRSRTAGFGLDVWTFLITPGWFG